MQRKQTQFHARMALRGRWLILGALLGMSLSGCAKTDGVFIEDPRIRDLLPVRDTTAAYFTLRNHTDRHRVLIGARSGLARSIEIHQSMSQGDTFSMRRVKRVTIEAGETINFEPGDLHLMVFGVEEVEDEFPITLHFEDDTDMEIVFRKLKFP